MVKKSRELLKLLCAALNKVNLCKFGAQLTERTNNPKLREKLLMSSDDLTPAKTVEIAFQLESTAGLPSQLASSSPSLSQPMLLTQLVEPTTRSPSPGSPQDSPEVNFARRPDLPCQMVEVSTLWQIQ